MISIRKSLLLLLVFIFIKVGHGHGQSSISKSVAIAEFDKINTAFRNMRYATFDMEMVLDTDTVNGKSLHDEQFATYTISDKSFYYKIGANEYMQNDSVMISALHDSKVLILEKSTHTNISNSFPAGEQIDSILSQFASNYTITQIDGADSVREISLIATEDTLRYKRITFFYNMYDYQLYKCEYEYYEPTTGEEEITTPPDSFAPLPEEADVPRKHILSIFFENYRFEPFNANGIFSEAKYIRFDGKKFWPAETYRNYEFYDRVTGEVREND